VKKVFFIETKSKEPVDSLVSKVQQLIRQSNLLSCISQNDLTAIKIHFGEDRNTTHIPPECVKPVADSIREKEGNPFLTDTNVLYRSQRDNAVDHLHLAHQHGFTLEKTGVPVVIADGLIGNLEKDVAIPGKIFSTVSISSTAIEANSLVIMSHVTGHMATGMGGAIKNLGMGFSSRKGKLRQHSVSKPSVTSKHCTGCGVCLEWCPADAIVMENDKAMIQNKICIGCGECITVCRFGAVKHDWGMGENELQKRMAEHALGVAISKKGKMGYINFLTNVTKDCDCISQDQDPLFPDIGILASFDPVAIDAASLDLIQERTGKSLTAISYPKVNAWVQISHGESIGLGTSKYELVEIS